jgi:hypothetical protein
MSTPPPFCPINPECERRFVAIETKQGETDKRVQNHGESIASLRAQLFMWSAFGALAGGALVAVFGRVVLR